MKMYNGVRSMMDVVEICERVIEQKGMSVNTFAERIERSVNWVQRLLEGEVEGIEMGELYRMMDRLGFDMKIEVEERKGKCNKNCGGG